MKNFTNILAVKNEETNSNVRKLLAELYAIESVNDILSKWYFKSYMTKGALSKTWELTALYGYLTNRINTDAEKKIAAFNTELNDIASANRIITNIAVSVEWSKSRTWGNCPKAEIRVCFANNTCDNYESGRITGCGFDKESTAIAQAINQCKEFKKALYTLKNTQVNKNNRDLFGYGSGYGVTPQLEGGVGVSCYPAIFNSIGYEWKGVSHGKAFDVYTIEKKISSPSQK